MAILCQIAALTRVVPPSPKERAFMLPRPLGEGWGEGGFDSQKIHSLPLFRGLVIKRFFNIFKQTKTQRKCWVFQFITLQKTALKHGVLV